MSFNKSITLVVSLALFKYSYFKVREKNLTNCDKKLLQTASGILRLIINDVIFLHLWKMFLLIY